MHAAAACRSACAASARASCRCSSVTLSSPSAVKKFVSERVEEALAVAAEVALHTRCGVAVEPAVGVLVVLEQERRDRRGEDEAVHAVLAVGADIAGHLAATHREADQGDVAQVELAQERRRGRW